MANEDSWIGKRLRTWGPSTPKDKPDVDGEVVGVRRPGFVDVKEERYDTSTLVNIHGGWASLIVLGLALAAYIYWPDNTHA